MSALSKIMVIYQGDNGKAPESREYNSWTDRVYVECEKGHEEQTVAFLQEKAKKEYKESGSGRHTITYAATIDKVVPITQLNLHKI